MTVPTFFELSLKCGRLLKSSRHTFSFFMTLKFSRVQAGEYQVNEGSKIIGYIMKKSSSKWVLYKCSNPSMLGNPIAVKKTLKELKLEAEAFLTGTSNVASFPVRTVEEDSLVRTPNYDDQKFELMREMLNRNYVINLNEYKQTEDGLEEVSKSFGQFLTEEEIAAL